MAMKLGDGHHYIRDFTADFTDQEVYIGGKSFPLGYMSVAVMNYEKEALESLLRAASAPYQAWQMLMSKKWNLELFDMAVKYLRETHEMLVDLEPFCYFDNEEERGLLDMVFSGEMRQSLNDCYAIGERFGSVSPKDVRLTEEEKKTVELGIQLREIMKDILKSYVYIANDLLNFCDAVINFETMELREEEERTEAGFARACERFFFSDETMLALRLLQPILKMDGFKRAFYAQAEIILLPDPKREGALTITKRYRFLRIMDFLVVDFFEGMHIGHAPRQCENCGRFFLTTDARHQKYCNGIDPNDPKGRPCRTVAARKGRKAKEKAEDHPVLVLYNRRCNTIDHHLRAGKIDEKFAQTAKEIAKKKRDRANRNSEYLRTEYESEMTQKAIYIETEQAMGRPPRARKEIACTSTPIPT